MRERLAVELSFRFHLIGAEVLDVIFFGSKLGFAVVLAIALGAKALRVLALFLDSGRLLFLTGVFNFVRWRAVF